jgi:hypothetical protein
VWFCSEYQEQKPQNCKHQRFPLCIDNNQNNNDDDKDGQKQNNHTKLQQNMSKQTIQFFDKQSTVTTQIIA